MSSLMNTILPLMLKNMSANLASVNHLTLSLRKGVPRKEK